MHKAIATQSSTEPSTPSASPPHGDSPMVPPSPTSLSPRPEPVTATDSSLTRYPEPSSPLVKTRRGQAKSLQVIALEIYLGINSVNSAVQAQIVGDYFPAGSTAADPFIVWSLENLIMQRLAIRLPLFESISTEVMTVTESSTFPVRKYHVVCVDALITYRTRRLPFPFTLRTVSKITLDRDSGTLAHYEDIWSVRDLKDLVKDVSLLWLVETAEAMLKDTPVLSAVYLRAIRPGVGSVVALVQVVMQALSIQTLGKSTQE